MKGSQDERRKTCSHGFTWWTWTPRGRRETWAPLRPRRSYTPHSLESQRGQTPAWRQTSLACSDQYSASETVGRENRSIAFNIRLLYHSFVSHAGRPQAGAVWETSPGEDWCAKKRNTVRKCGLHSHTGLLDVRHRLRVFQKNLTRGKS